MFPIPRATQMFKEQYVRLETNNSSLTNFTNFTNAQLDAKKRLTNIIPRSHQSLNMFKSCLAKHHGSKLFSLWKPLTDVFILQIQHKLKNMFKFI